MRILAFIEDEEVIEKILKHFGLWDSKARPPSEVKAPSETIYLDDSESQIFRLCSRQVLSLDSFYAQPDYRMDYTEFQNRLATSRVTISAIYHRFRYSPKPMI
jgi:hypothetical protein